MADNNNEPTSPSGGPAKRARAPTITIDTTAGDSPAEQRTPRGSTEQNRPTSPHNVSSPTQSNLLSVPVPRSRASSVDTDTGSTTSGTYLNTSSTGGDAQKEKLLEKDAHGHEVLSDEEALKPDPGTEADFVRENNPFAFTPGQFGKLINPKSLGAFHALGGLDGIEKGLRSDRKAGLSTDEAKLDGAVTFKEATGGAFVPDSPSVDPKAATVNHTPQGEGDSFADRLRIYSDNRLPERKSKSIWELAWIAYKDKILLLLTGAAVISLALGLYQTFGNSHAAEGSSGEWIEGVAIIVAILIVVFVGALNDWQKERQFVKLNKKKENRFVKAIRSGKTQEISVYDILVGDVILLEPGDLVPVDGIFIEGHGVKCDESSATGESDLLKKTAADDVWRAMENQEPLKKMDPFILSGSKVTEGVGRFMVTATGIHSSFGKTMMSLREDNDPTPLQMKLNILAEYIAKLGGAAALTLFVVLTIKFLAELRGNTRPAAEKGQQFLNIFIVAVTIVVVAVPEGLPLAVTLALAFATKKMTKDNNLVRVLRSCETMGNATTVCSDKTGTLTQNVMTVVAGSIGTSSRFANKAAVKDSESPSANAAKQVEEQLEDVGVQEFLKTLDESVKTAWRQSIASNSTAFESEDKGQIVFIGSKTETSILQFSRDFLGMGPISTERSNMEIPQMYPFDSGRKCMGVVIKLPDGRYRLYVKGASEIMLRHCTNIIKDPTKGMDPVAIPSDNVEALEHLIETYASRSLRTIGFIYRDFESWPPKGVPTLEDDKTQAQFDGVLKEMTFFGLVGIQDPLRPGVPEAVADCIRAGVFPRMVTGDNILTAKAIASECGIFTAGGVAMEGPVFRKLGKQQQREIIPKLQVLARSSPEDKRVLVRRLKEMGETVAVTGDGTNDAPALKAADVGFSMGIAGTEVAKEASDIILMDDNFTSIVKALMWGRAVNDAVRKFLQFQITVNITAVLLAFISAVSSDDETSVLTAVQLLWVNLIMDTFAALALATDPPTRGVLMRKPVPKSAGLFTRTMWKMIIGQSIFQLIVTLILYFAGKSIFGYTDPLEERQLRTSVFNTFVWMQIFNQVNSRRLDNKFNIFEGLFRNKFFLGINCIMIGGQVLIIFVGGSAFSVTRLTGVQWAYSIVLGALSWPVAIIIRLIPDELVAKIIPESVKRRRKPKVVVTDEDNPFEYNQGILEIKEELGFIKKYKGGRLNNLKFSVKHPREAFLHSRSRSEISLPPGTPVVEHADGEKGAAPPSPAPPTPEGKKSRSRGRSRSNSALAGAAMAGIVAGSIGGWSPINDPGENAGASLKFSRVRSKSDLSKEVPLEVHPDTKEEDPVFVENPMEAAGGVPPSQCVDTTPNFTIGPYAGQPRLSSDNREEKREDV